MLSIYQFQLHPLILHAAFLWVISHLMNLLSSFTPPTLLFNLESKSNRDSWKGGVCMCVCVCVCVCKGQGVVFLTDSFLESWFLLNGKDPLFWTTGWCDVWLSECLWVLAPVTDTGWQAQVTEIGIYCQLLLNEARKEEDENILQLWSQE